MQHLWWPLCLLLAIVQTCSSAKTSSWRKTPPADAASLLRQNSTQRLFTIRHHQTCVGTSYTKNAETNCHGWSGLTEEECEMKCAQNEQAPNCPQESCHAAVFTPVNGGCNLHKTCVQVEPSIGSVTLVDQEMLREEQEMEQQMAAEHEEPGRLHEVMTAMPIVLLNLTNFSGILHNVDVPSRDISYRAGNITADLGMLYDKVQGFLLALHEQMNPEDAAKYCPFETERVIPACIVIATCLIQKVVPTEISMDAFASLMEQVRRFEDITWPLLKTALIGEHEPDVQTDSYVPEAYKCDGVQEADPHSLVSPAFVQIEAKAAEGSEHSETLAMSSAMRHASAHTHRILDAHLMNSSMQTTAMQLEKLWHPICKKLPCDPSNMYDVFLAWHKQSMALCQTSAVGHLRLEIHQRVRLDMRLQRFVSEHYFEHVSFFNEKSVLHSSREAVVNYGKRGREAVIGLVIPYMQKLADTDGERAVRLVDHVELIKFARNMEKEKEGKLQIRRASQHAIGQSGEAEDLEEDVDEEVKDEDEDEVKDRPGPPTEDVSLLSESVNLTDGFATSHWCTRNTIVFWNHKHQRYFRMSNWRIERGHKGWQGNIPYGWTWERFTCVDLGGGNFAFHNTFHNRFMRMNGDGWMDRSDPCDKNKLPDHWGWERFKMKDMGNGHWALFSTAHNKFVKMDKGDGLVASGWRQGAWDIPASWNYEKFYIQKASREIASPKAFWFVDRTVAIWNHQHQRYVRLRKGKVEKGGAGWRDPFPNWGYERFTPVMAGHGEVAFYNAENRRFIRMNSDGYLDDSDKMDQWQLHDGMTWERFKVVDMGEGHIALYSSAHKKFWKMNGWEENLVTGPEMDYWKVDTNWGNEKFFLVEVGEKKNCNFWCRLRRGIEKVVKAVADFVVKLLSCFGQWVFTESVGYSRSISTHAAVNFGVSAGVSTPSIKSIIQQATSPGMSVSLWASLGAGATAEWLWSGLGVALYMSCGGAVDDSSGGCYFGVSVGAIFSAWAKAWGEPRCAFGPTLFGAFQCSRSVGGTFLLICCSYSILTGENSCR